VAEPKTGREPWTPDAGKQKASTRAVRLHQRRGQLGLAGIAKQIGVALTVIAQMRLGKHGFLPSTSRTGSQVSVFPQAFHEASRLGVDGAGERLRTHDLRHTFASILIREGADVVFVCRQLGHANPSITSRIYAHLFDAENQATKMREALEARFGGSAVVTSAGNGGERTGTIDAAKVVSMRR
jgi:integrase